MLKYPLRIPVYTADTIIRMAGHETEPTDQAERYKAARLRMIEAAR